MVTGAVQVPPDGTPIVLLCDHATVGGYHVIATVITADLPVLGHADPATRSASRPWMPTMPTWLGPRARRHLDAVVVGRYPVQAG